MTRRRALVLALAATAAAGAALPGAAQAHGLVQRANLPIPEWLFGWAAGAVLVLSFVALAVLWPRPRLEEPRWRPLPGALGRVPLARPVEVVLGVAGVVLLAVTVIAGFAGSPEPESNWAPTFVFITFWVGLAFASVLLGDVFRALSPWRALGRALEAAAPRLTRRRRAYPERLGRWPAAAVLLGFAWIELVSEWSSAPRTLASAIVGYTALTLVGQAVYGTETWTRRGEGFAVYFNLLSRIAPVEVRRGRLGVRPVLGGLPSLDPAPGTVAVVLTLIGTVTFDGLSAGTLWADAQAQLGDGRVVATLGVLLSTAVVAGFYGLGVLGVRSVGGGFAAGPLARSFVHTLVPIAMVYVAAHYLSFLLFEGQAIRYLASDPFSQGWDLFGTASAGIDYGVLSQNGTWYLQVAFVVAGHVAALVLAHDRALALYGDARTAARSQYWMLAVMVGFTSLALWLLAQVGA